MTVQSAFQNFIQKISPIYEPGEAHSIARIIFEDAFLLKKFQSIQFFSQENQQRLYQIESQLLANEPVQYILGEADFFGLKFAVDSRVLIPRQETEELVAIAIDFLSQFQPNKNNSRCLDIGTGSGCIPISIKRKSPVAEFWAIDKSGPALDLAAENAARHFTPIHFLKMDFLEIKNWLQLPDFQLITSNPPYIPTAEKRFMPPRVLDFEPPEALFVDDTNPLIFYENISSFAAEKLLTNGCLLLECNEFNALEVIEILKKHPFKTVDLVRDLSGKNRIAKALK